MIDHIVLDFQFLGDLAHAIRNRTDIVFGLYHSMFEWFNPLYLQDKEAGFQTQFFPTVCRRFSNEVDKNVLVLETL